MQIIYKYPLEEKLSTIVVKGKDPKVLFCGRDPRGQLSAWIEFTGHEEKDGIDSIVKIGIIGTGTLFFKRKYINSIIDGAFVWHFYQF